MKQRGFVALLSVLILSVVLLSVVGLMSIEVFFARTSVDDEQSYREARSAAYTCTHLILHSISIDQYRFEGNHDLPLRISLDTNSLCTVLEASSTLTNAGIILQGSSRDSYYTIYVEATRASSTAPFTIMKWREY